MAMSDQKSITLTVDGKSVTVPDGTTVLQACSPRLSVGNGRGEKASLPATRCKGSW